MRNTGKGPTSKDLPPKGGGALKRLKDFARQRGIDVPEDLSKAEKAVDNNKSTSKSATKSAPKRKSSDKD
jgi:hypothetical protein